MVFGICNHKWMPSANRVQTCSKCGKERVTECPHTWVKKEVYNITYRGMVKGDSWVLQCSKCGEVKTVHVGMV